MKLHFTRQAKDDLENIADHIHQENPEAALRVRDSIITHCVLLFFFHASGEDRRSRASGKS
jgi:plasmid stabilization system protein ParE